MHTSNAKCEKACNRNDDVSAAQRIAHSHAVRSAHHTADAWDRKSRSDHTLRRERVGS